MEKNSLIVIPAFDILNWDTEFFNYKVARINVKNKLSKETISELVNSNVQLAYYSSETMLSETYNEEYDIVLVDKKIVYLKQDLNVFPVDYIIPYPKSFPEEKLIQLAIESGIYSRFNADPKIGKQKFEELYKTWIINSVNRRIADEVLIYKLDNELVGFVTIGSKHGRGDIGIIAVDREYRGKNIGRSLMLAAESYCKKKYAEMQVVTQRDNIPACKLYEKCGFKIESVEYFYHLWKR